LLVKVGTGDHSEWSGGRGPASKVFTGPKKILGRQGSKMEKSKRVWGGKLGLKSPGGARRPQNPAKQYGKGEPTETPD